VRPYQGWEVTLSALRLLALLALAALVRSPALAAPTPEQLATKSFLTRQKAALKTFRSALKLAENQAALELRTIETTLAANDNVFVAGNETITTLNEFQSAVQDATQEATGEQGEAAKDALASIGAPLDGHYPEAFYLSDNEPAALFLEALNADRAKLYVRMRKRVARLRGRFEDADFLFSFRLRPPRPIDQVSWNEGFTFGNASWQSTTDVVVAWSSIATDGDGQLRAAGSAYEGPIDVSVDNGLDALPPAEAVVVDGRWLTFFNEESFTEGLWIVHVPGPGEIAIGIR
jgi:hypothetical protein